MYLSKFNGGNIMKKRKMTSRDKTAFEKIKIGLQKQIKISQAKAKIQGMVFY
jgi:hypothetical protein